MIRSAVPTTLRSLLRSDLVAVNLQFPYELSFLSVFWITSKSNQKYMLDVVKEVFSRSGRTKTQCNHGF